MPLAPGDGWAIPFDAPFYPRLPAWYRNVEFQQVFFRSDPAAVARLLPEPLEPSPDGECVATGIRVPFSSAYGGFNEAVIEEKAIFRGQTGWYVSHVWHDGPRGIAAGREIYGTPKIFSELEVRLVDASMLTRASMGGAPVLTISSTMDEPVAPSDLPSLSPAWRLKIIPRADRPEPAIKQLIDGSGATGDLQVHAAFRGRGTVHFEPSPFGDLTGLRPLEYGAAYYFEASYSEGFATIVHDYLAPGS
ncbi:MAG TPA: acetoacetate decarboxylase family protein [Candidatus Saccharimonadales bacterium]|nr:acetoacetate decarboxylase family protein [Candidatus Saccharimonadales bacterium]